MQGDAVLLAWEETKDFDRGRGFDFDLQVQDEDGFRPNKTNITAADCPNLIKFKIFGGKGKFNLKSIIDFIKR